MNIFTFTGNLGKDAELKSTQAGNHVLTFTVAVKSGYGDREKTNWVHCSVFGKRAEGNLVSYLTKGQQVAVSGEFELKEWQAQDGTQNKMPSVLVRELDLVGGKPSGNAITHNAAQGAYQQPRQQPQGFQNAPNQATQPAQPGPGGFEDFDDDISF